MRKEIITRVAVDFANGFTIGAFNTDESALTAIDAYQTTFPNAMIRLLEVEIKSDGSIVSSSATL